MSANTNGERPIGEEIDAMFQDSYGETTKGRIVLAAHAISTCVNRLDMLEYQQRKAYESVGSASRLDISLRGLGYTSAFAPIVFPDTNNSEKTGVDRIIELFEGDEDDEHFVSLFDPIEKAKLALKASTDGARAAHNLSRLQGYRAVMHVRKYSR
jgi:hypothetical protein